MEQFAILRLGTIQKNLDDTQFNFAIEDLKSTKYKRNALQQEAPASTHCISAVRYIVQKSCSIKLPIAYIGDFCKNILEFHQILEPQILPINNHERGDFIFFMRRSVAHRAYMITHIGIFTDNDGSFFHSNWSSDGQQDTISRFLTNGKIATCKVLSNYTDPRRIK